MFWTEISWTKYVMSFNFESIITIDHVQNVILLIAFESIITIDHVQNVILLIAFLFERYFYNDMNQYGKFTDIFWHSSVTETWTFSRWYSQLGKFFGIHLDPSHALYVMIKTIKMCHIILENHTFLWQDKSETI